MMEEGQESSTIRSGCIKTSRGAWVVHRRNRQGLMYKSWRRPSDEERKNNLIRERQRREVARRIYAGLREHGNYLLPKHSDQNDVLIALCQEAGWHVEDDGTIYRKNPTHNTLRGSKKDFEAQLSPGFHGTTHPLDNTTTFGLSFLQAPSPIKTAMDLKEDTLDLSLSLALPGRSLFRRNKYDLY